MLNPKFVCQSIQTIYMLCLTQLTVEKYGRVVYLFFIIKILILLQQNTSAKRVNKRNFVLLKFKRANR